MADEIEADIGISMAAPLNTAPPPPAEPPIGGTMQGGSTNAPPSGFAGWLFKLFDVNTVDVAERIKLAVNPFAGQTFLTGTLDGELGAILGTKWPDLWGPVWIYQTAVFALFLSTTVAGMMFSAWRGVRYEYSIEVLTSASFALGLCTFGGPALLWLAVQFFNLAPQLTLPQMLCLFGYANVVWIPIVLLEGSLPPVLIGYTAATIIRWLFAGIGAVLSGIFVLRNIRQMIAQEASKSTLVLLGSGMLQAAVGVLVAAMVTAATHNGSE